MQGDSDQPIDVDEPPITTPCTTPYCGGRVTWWGRCDRCAARTCFVNCLPGDDKPADAVLKAERDELLATNLKLEDELAAYRIMASRKLRQLRRLCHDDERKALRRVLELFATGGWNLSEIIDGLPCTDGISFEYERCEGILTVMARLLDEPDEPDRVCRTCKYRTVQVEAVGGTKKTVCGCEGAPYEGYTIALSHSCEDWTQRQLPIIEAPNGRFIGEESLRKLVDRWRAMSTQPAQGSYRDAMTRCADELEKTLR